MWKALNLQQILKENNFGGVQDELQSKNDFQRQAVTKYLRVTLVFLCKSTIWEKFNRFFLGTFWLVLTKFLFWYIDWAPSSHSMKFRHFTNIYYFPQSLSLQSFGNSWGSSYIPCLKLIISHRFTFVEGEIRWNIKKF